MNPVSNTKLLTTMATIIAQLIMDELFSSKSEVVEIICLGIFEFNHRLKGKQLPSSANVKENQRLVFPKIS